MPFGNGTGPSGLGPMTGRGLGYCAGFNRPGYTYPGLGRGWFGRGRGRGWRNWYYATGLPGWQRGDFIPTAKEEIQILKEEAEILKKELADIESTIQDLKTKKKK